MRSRRSFIKKASVGIIGINATHLLGVLPDEKINSDLAPYLQNPCIDGITIMWRTSELSYSWVEYGEDTNTLEVARTVKNGIVVANVTAHKVKIEGLLPNTKYYYRICSRKVLKYQAYSKELGPEVKSSFFSFTTLSQSPEDFTCLIFNDLHDNLMLFDKLIRQVHLHKIKFDFSIFNGDIFNDPESESKILNSLSHYNEGVDASNRLAIYLRGNHEIRGPYALEFPVFFEWEKDKNYFSFSYGDTRFVFLDNGEDKNDNHVEYSGLVDFDKFRNEQTEWLKKEIDSSEFKGAFRRILVHHIPIYGWKSSVDPGFIPCYNLWDPIFKTALFDIDITGHLHKFNFHTKNKVGNPFPLVVGGGNAESNGRVMVLIKKGDALTLKSLDSEGNMEVYTIYKENVSLNNVTILGGELTPGFEPNITEYDILVTSQIATLSVLGESTLGTVKGNIDNKICTVGQKIILKAIADDGTEKEYTFTVRLKSELPTDGNPSGEIKIYPNPLKQGSPIHIALDKHYDRVIINVVSMTGTLIDSKNMTGMILTMPLNLSQGIYIISVNTEKRQYAHKILVS